MPLAVYDLGDLLWSMFVFFAWIIFFWLLFIVFGDLFRRHDVSGWGKAGLDGLRHPAARTSASSCT